jgi:predicted RNA-binding Zn-ribbon protein involved in translation (DUF1610 family)
MRLTERPELFILLMFIGFWILFFSIWGIIFNKDWNMLILTLYVLLLLSSVIILVLKSHKCKIKINKIEEFEKKLKGGLYHFKCLSCNGIFAIKESTNINKKSVRITCPDCGKLGIIPSYPIQVKGDIPEIKSVNVIFQCNLCGESITIWAEGANLYNGVCVYSCPFCGEEEKMKRI